jgi:hypothetical protein
MSSLAAHHPFVSEECYESIRVLLLLPTKRKTTKRIITLKLQRCKTQDTYLSIENSYICNLL